MKRGHFPVPLSIHPSKTYKDLGSTSSFVSAYQENVVFARFPPDKTLSLCESSSFVIDTGKVINFLLSAPARLAVHTDMVS